MKLENLHCSGRAGNLSFEFVDEELEKNSRILFADFVFQSQCVHVLGFLALDFKLFQNFLDSPGVLQSNPDRLASPWKFH